MNIIHALPFELVDDPIKTEQLINEQLLNKEFSIPYVSMPLAYTINKLGLSKTQQLIDEIEQKFPQKKFYVCQHIMVKNLNFHNNIVFTPHTEKTDRFFFIPHYNPLYSEKPNKISIKNRKYRMSFIGDFASDRTRHLLSKLKSSENIIEHTGRWHFYLNEEQQNINKKRYKEVLENSQISLCPRGTGPSTLRFFESISVGSVPVIFNDLNLPDELENLIYKMNIDEIHKISFDIDELQKKSDLVFEYYWDNLSNTNLYKTIEKKLADI
jgi:hypothetical protein